MGGIISVLSVHTSIACTGKSMPTLKLKKGGEQDIVQPVLFCFCLLALSFNDPRWTPLMEYIKKSLSRLSLAMVVSF
jgi:hypothetical protein